jgi:hypothetical protein
MWRALDPGSQLACRRLLTTLVLITLWAFALSPHAVPAAIALLCCGCAAMSALFALLRREPVWGQSFGRWDEAAVLFGVQCMARFLA